MKHASKVIIVFAVCFSLILYVLPAAAATRGPLVVLVVLDGGRADAVRLQKKGAFASLARDGSYTYDARTVLPSKTIPAHASLFTGLSVKHHGITTDTEATGILAFSTLFDYLMGHKKRSVVLFGKEKLNYFPISSDPLTIEVVPGGAELVAKRAHDFLKQKTIDFIYLHFADPDIAGHSYGASSSEYAKAIQKSDRALGSVLSVIKKYQKSRPVTIILTADHGMRKKSHGGDTPQERFIPWIIKGASIKRGYHIKTPVNIYDTTPTILRIFGIPIPQDIDGKVIDGIFRK